MEIKKNSSLGDITSYLPLDTPNNVREFLKITQPHLAVFVKYELWPNYLRELRSRGIRSLLISATFRKNQIFFKPYGSWLKRSLFSFDHIFVQDPASEQLLKEQGFSKVTLSGDTRFDRVSEQLLQDNEVEFAAQFKSGKICMVAGSTWPEDEDLLLPFINSRPNGVKFIIAPHNIDKERIRRLKARLTVKTVQYSGMKGKDLSEYEVLILDIIGYLGRVYSYGEIAYVGGAAGKTGLHNILEPAAFGIPVITGKNIRDYPEARGLQQYGGLFVADVPEELRVLTQHFLQDPEARRQAGERSRNFVQSNSGATGKIIQYLLKEK